MEKERKKTVLYKKSVARLIVCQALCTFYDENNGEKDINVIIKNINDFFIKDKFSYCNKNDFVNVYRSSFVSKLLTYVINNRDDLNNKVKQSLNQEETIETIDPMVLEILKTAIAETELYESIDKTIIINEYVDITAEFFDNIYVTFVNGVLNAIFYGKENNTKPKDFNVYPYEDGNKQNKHKHKIIKLKNK